MSAIMTGLVWELPIDGAFGRPEKYILLAYADHADQNGRSIYPSVELISKKTGYEERAVQMITRNLQQMGYLLDDGQGPHGTNRWMIPLKRESQGGAKIAPLPVQKNAPEGIAPEENAPEGIAPELVVEEVKESTTTTTAPNIFALYEQNIGVLTPLIADALKDAETTYPPDWISGAIAEAVASNKRNWKYVLAILARWQVDGPHSPKPGGKHVTKNNRTPGKANAPTSAPLDDAARRRAERINAKRRQAATGATSG